MFAVAVGGLMIPATPRRALAADATAPRLASSEGRASARAHPKLPWRNVRVGRELTFGHQLKCTASCNLSLAGEATLGLEAGAMIRPEGPQFTRFPEDVTARRVEALSVDDGVVHLVRPQDDGSATVVRLPSGAKIALRSGELTVHALDGRGAIDLRSGTALIRAERTWAPIAPGLYDASPHGLTERAPVASASWEPKDPHHRPVAVATDLPEGQVSMSWERDRTRSKQRLVVRDEDGGVVADRAVDPATAHATLMLREGRYRAHLYVADEDGIWSRPSPPLPLRVVRLALPAGGIHAEADTFVVPDDATLRLLGAEGIEVAMGRGGFLPARRELRVPDANVSVMKLRVAGAPATESRFYLEQRELRAQITLGPSSPVWPQDAVAAEVRLVDPSGRVDVDGVKPRFRVRVGADDIPTHFTFNGQRWHGRIPGRHLRQPQLLELTVEDEVGQAIGQAFLEVVAHKDERSR
ncbi:MAG TPA: hypothetical protein ENK57_10760 [Polyangiaceae bacterium]|nr:hypothetical protein [Polyangiaceae bacterium]